MVIDLILIGAAIALEPLPLTGYLVLLSSENGTRKGLGFLLGWIVTLVAVVVLALLLTGGKPPKPATAPSQAILIAKIVLGVGLLGLAWRQRGRRGRATTPPSWMAKIDRLNFVAAMSLGFLLQPWPLVAAGALTVTGADLSKASSWAALVAFAVLASSSYLAMQTYVMASPAAARLRLNGLNLWLTAHRDDVIIVVSVAIGLWLIGHSAYLLAS
jgi:Sap-like sulfolipid-1-addressing protein